MTSRIQQETPVPQPFFSQFPTQKNREIILRNREFKRVIREKRAGRVAPSKNASDQLTFDPDRSCPTQVISPLRGGSAPTRVHVKAAQLHAKESARRSSSLPISFSRLLASRP